MDSAAESQPDPSPTGRPAGAPPDAVILAAGKGKRMGGDRAKCVYEVADRPMVWWVVNACRDAGVGRCVVVVGHGGDEVRQVFAGESDVEFVEQAEQLGTGHAARMAEPLFQGRPANDVFVLAGDGPLIRADTLRTLLDTHRTADAAATLATAVIDDPTGYGRVIRDSAGLFQAIVEQKDATDEQRQVREINPSYYLFRSDLLFDSLAQVRNDNSQGEYYVTDVPGLLKTQGRTVAVVDAVPAEDVLSINTPEQLAEVDRILRTRLAAQSDTLRSNQPSPAGATETDA